MDLKAGCCQTCKAFCAGDFKKVLNLQDSGLVVYLYNRKDEKNTATAKMDFILHNTRSKQLQLQHPDLMTEIYKFKTQCGQCNSVVETVRSLLGEIRYVKEKEVIGLCEHCIRKQANFNKTCKRCNYLVKKFIEMHQKQCQEKQDRFKVWLCRVRHLLQAILDSQSTCRHRVYRDPDLERILRSLREPCVNQQLDIDLYPTRDPDKTICLKRLSENKKMLDELLTRIKSEGETDFTSEASIYPCSSEETCMCKALKERLLEGKHLGFGEEPSDLSSLLSQDMYKELIQKLLDLSKALYLGFNINKKLKLELIATLNIAINQKLAPDITKKLINQLNDLTAIMTHGLSKSDDYDVQAIQDLINDLKKILFSRSAKTINKDLIELLSDLTKLLSAELSKVFSEEKMEIFSKTSLSRQSEVKSQSIITKKDKTEVLPKTKIDKDVSQENTKHPPTKDPLTKDLSSKDRPRKDLALKELSKIPKDEKQGLTKFQEKEVVPPDRGKDLTRKSIQDSSKAITRPKSRDTTHELPKDGSERESPKSQREHEKQAQKAKGTTQSKDSAVNKQLAQKIGDLYKALKKGDLQKEQIQQISDDIKKTLPLKSPDLNKKIIQEVTELCEPATEGIASDANLELVQGILKDVKKSMTKGLSNDQNKKEVQGRLQNLYNALVTKKDRGKLPASIKKDTRKSSGFSSKPESKDLSKNGLKDNIDRKTLKPGKDTTKEKQSLAPEDLLNSQTKKQNTRSGEDPPENGPMSKTEILKERGTQTQSSEEGFSVPIDAIKKLMQTQEQKTKLSRPKPKTDIKSRQNSIKQMKSIANGEGLISTPKEKNKKSQTKSSLKGMKEKENITPKDETKKDDVTQNKKRDKDKTKKDDTQDKERELKQTDKLRKKKTNAMLKRILNADKHLARGKFRERQLVIQKEKERKKRDRLLALQKEPTKLKKKAPLIISKKSSSIIQCDIGKEISNEMIEGESIKPLHPRYKDNILQTLRQPMYFHTSVEFTESHKFKTDSLSRIYENVTTKRRDLEEIFQSGMFKYQLSNKEFIDKGWTLLPTAKMMRRMNIYKMRPANPQYDWFERHKKQKLLTYECGEILATINDDGRGRWFYRNRQVALEYYDAEELNVGQRYIIYSSDEDKENGKLKQKMILALFDFLGNGVVYDHNGAVRLKYNQSEGVIVDPKLGPPSKWKWHALNEPPDLHQEFVNVCMSERDPRLEEAARKAPTGDQGYNIDKTSDSDMLAIELDNFVKEKATRALQIFRPFQIRMKAVKLNDNFALKILDQANIYLLFRDGITSLKLNLGMNLISDEIIDTVTTEMTTDMLDVHTPYDKFPARSESVANIQKFLKMTRSGKVH